jgi:hypothetical protein
VRGGSELHLAVLQRLCAASTPATVLLHMRTVSTRAISRAELHAVMLRLTCVTSTLCWLLHAASP